MGDEADAVLSMLESELALSAADEAVLATNTTPAKSISEEEFMQMKIELEEKVRKEMEAHFEKELKRRLQETFGTASPPSTATANEDKAATSAATSAASAKSAKPKPKPKPAHESQPTNAQPGKKQSDSAKQPQLQTKPKPSSTPNQKSTAKTQPNPLPTKKSDKPAQDKPPVKAADVDIDKLSQLNIERRVLKPLDVAVTFGDSRPFVPLNKVESFLRAQPKQPNHRLSWGTTGVILERRDPKKNSKGETFLSWKFTDLDQTNLLVCLYGEALETMSKLQPRTVVAILDAKYHLPDKKDQNAILNVSKSEQLMEIGYAADMTRCPGIGASGCNNYINKSKVHFCTMHATAFMRSAQSTRMEFQNPNQPRPKDNQPHHPPQPRAVFRPPVQANDAKKKKELLEKLNKEREEKNKAGLAELEAFNKNNPGVLVKPSNTSKQAIPLVDSKISRAAGWNVNSWTGEALPKDNEVSIDTTPMLGRGFGSDDELELSDDEDGSKRKGSFSSKAVERLKEMTPATCLQQHKLAFDRTRLEKLREAAIEHERLQKAKFEAELLSGGRYVDQSKLLDETTQTEEETEEDNANQQKRSRSQIERFVSEKRKKTKKTPELSMPGAARVDKRIAPSTTDTSELATKKPKTIVEVFGKGLKLDAETMKQMMAKKTVAGDHVAAVERSRRDAYLDDMEKRESVANQLSTVTSLNVTGFFCHECNMLMEYRGPLCIEKQHRLETRKLKKQFFKCNSCQERTNVLSISMLKPCSKCGASSWAKTSYMHIHDPKMPKLLPRGEEHAFSIN